jgi:hypothetical protein
MATLNIADGGWAMDADDEDDQSRLRDAGCHVTLSTRNWLREICYAL